MEIPLNKSWTKLHQDEKNINSIHKGENAEYVEGGYKLESLFVFGPGKQHKIQKIKTSLRWGRPLLLSQHKL